MKFAVCAFLPLFSVEVPRMCVARTPRPPTACVMPAWVFVEGKVSGIRKQVSQITTRSTTNVTSSRHRLISIAIKIKCQDDCIRLSVPLASQPRANTKCLNPTLPSVQPLTLLRWHSLSFTRSHFPFSSLSVNLLSDSSPFCLPSCFLPFHFS